MLKLSGVETSANGLWSPNGLYLFMQALASPQDSVALTQEDSKGLEKKNDPASGSLSILGQWVDTRQCQWSAELTSVDHVPLLSPVVQFILMSQASFLVII